MTFIPASLLAAAHKIQCRYTGPMNKGKHLKSLISCLLLGTLIGFFAGGGWEILFKFDQWRSETFYRAHDDEIILVGLWFLFGPARWTIAGAVLGGLASFMIAKSKEKSSV